MNSLNQNDIYLANLKELYEHHGYSRFRMSKFEEYDLYLEYRNFLRTDNIITFNDKSGRLMALKPDITLSIAKNAKDGEIKKVYYNENVYRTPKGSDEYKEITQVGLEYIGDIDMFNLFEVLYLAAKSLCAVSGDEYVMDISHMGFITDIIRESGLNVSDAEKMLSFIGQKNAHDAALLCDAAGIGGDMKDKILGLARIYGPLCDTLPRVRSLVCGDMSASAADELASLCRALSSCGLSEKVNLDFSIVNDMNYYNGLIFQGYVRGIPQAVLSGGRYDNLLKKLGKESQAIGFALYMDLLELYAHNDRTSDVDVLLIYDDSDSPEAVLSECEAIIASGRSVRADRHVNDSLKYGVKCVMKNGKAVCE